MKTEHFMGRWPHLPGVLVPRDMQGNVDEDEDGIHVRLDCSAYPDFWLEFTIVREETRKALEENGVLRCSVQRSQAGNCERCGDEGERVALGDEREELCVECATAVMRDRMWNLIEKGECDVSSE